MNSKASLVRGRVEVTEEYFSASAHNEDELRMYLSGHNATILSPSVKVSTDKEKVIYSTLVSIFFSFLSPTWAR